MNEHYEHRSYPITDREPLHYTLAEDSDGNPLATFHNLPGDDADLTPEQCRSLAAALNWAAEQQPQTSIDNAKRRRLDHPKNPFFHDSMVDTASACVSVLSFLETLNHSSCALNLDDQDRAGLVWILEGVREALQYEIVKEVRA